jgi:hypothetical protein
MGLFDDGEHNDMGDLFNQLPGGIWRGLKFIWGVGLKPTIKDIQKARAKMAMDRAVNEMQGKIQSSGSAQGNAIAQSNSVATPDLSPPPVRKRQG